MRSSPRLVSAPKLALVRGLLWSVSFGAGLALPEVWRLPAFVFFASTVGHTLVLRGYDKGLTMRSWYSILVASGAIAVGGIAAQTTRDRITEGLAIALISLVLLALAGKHAVNSSSGAAPNS